MRHKFSPHYWEAAILRFCRHFRYRADAKLSPYPWGAKRPGFRRCFAAGFMQNFHRTHGVRNAPVSAAASLPGSRKTFTAPMGCETIRFPPLFRCRVHAKLSPYPWGAKRSGFRRCFAAGFMQNFHRTHGVRNAPVSAAASLPGSCKTFTAPMGCETPRFPPLLRCRVHAKLSPYPWGAKRSGFLRCFDTGLTQKTYKYILKAPLKKRI